MTEKYHQIILHVGLHKTGTTSIQNNIQRHSDALLEHDIYYPVFRYQDIVKANHSGPITAMVCDSPDVHGKQWRTDLGDAVDSIQREYQSTFREVLEQPKGHTLVLSGETVSVFNIDDLQKLREILTPHTHKLRVLVYIRDPANSVASTLQQRIRDGSDRDSSHHIQKLARLARKRYRRLIEVFPDTLEVVNFHEEVLHESGLVGSFLIRCGLPSEEANSLNYSVANPRMSMETFNIMAAINKRYPAKPNALGKRVRPYNDMHSLSLLPGQPFRLLGLENKDIRNTIREEAEWLKDTLKLQFPSQPESAPGQLWGDAVLFALEDAILGLEHRDHQIAAADFLECESRELQNSQPHISAVLSFIAQKIYRAEKTAVQIIAKRLGADFFKNGALQAESHSITLALELMQIAAHLRPDGTTIKRSIQKYLKILGD